MVFEGTPQTKTNNAVAEQHKAESGFEPEAHESPVTMLPPVKRPPSKTTRQWVTQYIPNIAVMTASGFFGSVLRLSLGIAFCSCSVLLFRSTVCSAEGAEAEAALVWFNFREMFLFLFC